MKWNLLIRVYRLGVRGLGEYGDCGHKGVLGITAKKM